MDNQLAQRLWEAARQTGGTIVLADVSESDIARGRANDWLVCTRIGLFEPTEDLRKAALVTAL